jgi:hypothetical protein
MTSRLLVPGAVAALAGLVLFVVEASRAIGGTALGGAGSALLWVGLGLLVAGCLLLLGAAASSADGRSDGGQPADG